MKLVDILSKLESVIKIGDGNKFSIFDKFINIENKTININLKEANKEELKQIKEILAPELERAIESSDSGHLIEETGVKDDIKLIEESSSKKSIQKELTFIEEKLPKKDVSIWYSALILKEQHEAGEKEKVRLLKQQIIVNSGQRGANIANLCTTGYLESHLIPLYKHLVEELGNEAEFIRQYEVIVEDTILTVFCSIIDKPEELEKEIIEKINRVKDYGWDRVYIHAIGQSNVKNVKIAVDNIKKNCEKVKDIKEISDNEHIVITIFI